ncbi:MAG: hypothetical protein LH660_07005 [Phormidesmis sp. CAN_BIN36]|nr:hypothetical protein [Phormidesmis sp. CAN_BIN36]
MNCQVRPHPSPLPKGEGTGLLAPFSLGRRVGEGFAPLREEGNSYLHSATPRFLQNLSDYLAQCAIVCCFQICCFQK